ncbi:hypothetical protein [Lysinibacillus sp. 54212]|uniref:hypothetical protein n=1 Tax=Lysinibacillus sp. 54212 TaxID=3119829 RepID=UPI002FC6C1CF
MFGGSFKKYGGSFAKIGGTIKKIGGSFQFFGGTHLLKFKEAFNDDKCSEIPSI